MTGNKQLNISIIKKERKSLVSTCEKLIHSGNEVLSEVWKKFSQVFLYGGIALWWLFKRTED